LEPLKLIEPGPFIVPPEKFNPPEFIEPITLSVPPLKFKAPNVLNTELLATVNVIEEFGIVRLLTEVEISSVTV
jgi:hypothetical protein